MIGAAYPVGARMHLINTTKTNKNIPLATTLEILSVAIYAEGYVYPVEGTTIDDDCQWCYEVEHRGEGAIVTHDEIEPLG